MVDENWQGLCDSLYNETKGILACYVVDVRGKILGRNFGRIEAPADLRSKYGGIAAVLWGGLLNIEQIGGRLSMLTASFEKFKVLGFRFPGRRPAYWPPCP